jgi:hypothetical protein
MYMGRVSMMGRTAIFKGAAAGWSAALVGPAVTAFDVQADRRSRKLNKVNAFFRFIELGFLSHGSMEIMMEDSHPR